MDCPYIQLGSPGKIVCDGENHIILGTDVKKPCPLVSEALMWAGEFGVRGDRQYLFRTFVVTPENEKAFIAVSQWAKNPSGILILASKPGLGKSRLALSAWYHIRRNMHKCWILSSTSFHELAVLHSRGEDEDRIKKYIGTSPVFVDAQNLECQPIIQERRVPLVFDDLGSERTSDTFRDFFKRLIDYRENILITTNYTSGDLCTLLGDRVWSRLSPAKWVYITGRDMRSTFTL